MLAHEEREALARHIAGRLAARHGEDLLLVGVYGSLARGTDTPWSDLDMLVISRDGVEMPGRSFAYRGTAAGYQALTEGELRRRVTTPSERWPFWMGVLSALCVLYGDPVRVEGWLAEGRAVPQAALRDVLRGALPVLVIESYGRVRSSVVRGDAADLHVSAVEVLLEMLTALCLLNGRWVTHDYSRGLVDAAAFPLLPEGWETLAPALWRCQDAHEAVALAERLVAGYLELLAREGVPLDDLQRLEDLDL